MTDFPNKQYPKFPGRFLVKAKTGRHEIPRKIKNEVYQRDSFTCQYCGVQPPTAQLTIDHLIPLSQGGLDEIFNYVTACKSCNQRKSNLPLELFAQSIKIDISALPVHGDPVIDNVALPMQIRLLRKKVYDKVRSREITISGRATPNKLEKAYRREFWKTPEGKALESEFPNLPGQVRIMIPEIRTVSKNLREYLLLVELAKSANTRTLVGSLLTHDCEVESRLADIQKKTKDLSLKKRIEQALTRFQRELKRRNLA